MRPSHIRQPEPVKVPVRVATTANGALHGSGGSPSAFAALQTVDTIQLDVGDRVLVKDQTVPAENGIYRVTAGDPALDLDADQDWNLEIGAMVLATEGAVNSNRVFVVATVGPLSVVDLIRYSGTSPAALQPGGAVGTSRLPARSDHAHPTTGLLRGLGAFYVDAGNVVATGDTEVYPLTIAGNTFHSAGEGLFFDYYGRATSHATNTRQIRLQFAGNDIANSMSRVTPVASTWHISGNILISAYGSGGTSCSVRSSVQLLWLDSAGVPVIVGSGVATYGSIDLTSSKVLRLVLNGSGANDVVVAQSGVVTCGTGT